MYTHRRRLRFYNNYTHNTYVVKSEKQCTPVLLLMYCIVRACPCVCVFKTSTIKCYVFFVSLTIARTRETIEFSINILYILYIVPRYIFQDNSTNELQRFYIGIPKRSNPIVYDLMGFCTPHSVLIYYVSRNRFSFFFSIIKAKNVLYKYYNKTIC